MGRKSVPVKTKEGTHEIRARALGLAPRIRTALLLVDGVKSTAELERLMAAAGVTPGALQLLLDKGLIRFAEEEAESTADSESAGDAARASLGHQGDEGSATVAEEGPQRTVAVGATTVLDVPTLIEPPQLRAPVSPAPKRAVHAVPDAPRAQDPAQAKPQVNSPEIPQERKQESASTAPLRAVRSERVLSAPLEVVTLLELETILGGATKMEVATILGVATMLELTPTQMMAPDTAVKKPPPAEPARLPPLAQAQRQHELKAVPAAPQMVVPAAVLRMNLMAARAHLAAALDQYLEVEVYVLRQKVAAAESREELEQLYALVEGALIAKIDRTAATRILRIATEILDR
jgi:hypothetical protein